MAVCIADRHLHGIASAALGHDDKLFRFRNAQRIAFDFLRAAEHDHLSLIRRKASGNAQLKAHRLCSGYRVTHIRPELNGKLFHFFGLFRRFRLFRRFGFFRCFRLFRCFRDFFGRLGFFRHFRLRSRFFADFRSRRFLGLFRRFRFFRGGRVLFLHGLCGFGFRLGFGFSGFFRCRFFLHHRLNVLHHSGGFLHRRHFFCQAHICQQHNAHQQE